MTNRDGMTSIAKFLNAKEPLFDHALLQLEERSGKKGIDAVLAGEIAAKCADRIKRLGLHQDCSAEELYAALVRQIEIHDEHLAHTIGGHDINSIPEMIPLIVAAVAKIDMPRQGFFLKESKAAQMLSKMPPLAVMQRLGYDNVATMLEHENIYELFLALRFGQEADWLNQFDATYHQLRAEDFEVRDIKVVIFDPVKWGDIAAKFIEKKVHNIANNKEIGAIGVMPMTQLTMRGVTLKVFPLMLHYFNELRLYSAFFKLMRPKKDFGEIVATTLIAGPSHVKVVEFGKIHWRVIQRYFGKLKHENHPEIFEPHLQPEDLHWRRAVEILYEVDPELEFWRDMDYTAVLKGGEIVTFNLMDISLGSSNQVPFVDRYLYHFRESLWNEVFARYLGQKALEEQLLVKLDNDVIKPEELGIK